MKSVRYNRKLGVYNFSCERLFEGIRLKMAGDINVEVSFSRFPSKALSRRATDMCRAVVRQEEVNHIIGDVHFLTYLLK